MGLTMDFSLDELTGNKCLARVVAALIVQLNCARVMMRGARAALLDPADGPGQAAARRRWQHPRCRRRYPPRLARPDAGAEQARPRRPDTGTGPQRVRAGAPP